jgi:hypothetical protein
MSRLQDENADLKTKYNDLVTDEREKFEEIKKKLGLEYSIN